MEKCRKEHGRHDDEARKEEGAGTGCKRVKRMLEQ